MKQGKLLLILLTTIALVGCSSKKVTPTSESEYIDDFEEKDPDYQDIPIEMVALLNRKLDSYSLTIPYQKRYFKNPTTEFNKSLALLSFGVCVNSYWKNSITDIYQKLDFDNLYLSSDYDITPTEETVAYAIGHRQIDDFHLIQVSIRSADYGLEWANNFDIGLDGNHYGFDRAMKIVKAGVVDYVNDNYKDENVKFWINGYSRGAAIANMLADTLMSEKEIIINEDNAYVYTFETPKGFIKENTHAYKNIMNVVNSADIVSYLAPEQYGFYRSGVDVDIYNSKIDSLMSNFDKGILFPPLIAKSGRFRNDYEHAKYILNSSLREGTVQEGEEDRYMPTRSDFVNKYQPCIKWLINFLFTVDSTTLNNIKDAFTELSNNDKLKLKDGDNLYLFLKEQLDKSSYPYNDEELHNACTGLKNLISVPLSTLIDEVVSGSNITRLLYMHTPEVVYTLLKNYPRNK